MARRSKRLTASDSKPAAHKRAGSSSVAVSDPKRGKARHTDDQDDQDDLTASSASSYCDFEADDGEAQDVSEDGDEDVSENSEDRPATKKGHSSGPSGAAKDVELYRPGVKVIPKIRARPAGDVPYTNDSIHPNTLLFLKELSANNNRPWLKVHDAEFRQAEKDWFSFLESLTERLTVIDETVPDLPVKDLTFRIYRDIRFSPNPTPYKTHFSAAWSRTGRKGPYAAYYLQVGHGDCFFGCGLWSPDAEATAAMRREFDRRPERMKRVLMADKIRSVFLDGSPDDEAASVKAFCQSNSKNALKTRPKGFDADHREIELLKLKKYTLGAKLHDQQILGLDGQRHILELMALAQPFVAFVNSVVKPDEPFSGSEGESDADSSEEENEEDETA